MNETYGRAVQDQEKLGKIILIISSSLAAALVLAGLIYATGTAGRSTAALAAAGCEPGMSSDSAPCTTQQMLIGQYTAIMTPASQQLEVDEAAYAANEGHSLAAAEAALMAEVTSEHAFDTSLAAMKFPPAIAPVAAALVRADQARVKLLAEQAQSSSLTQLRSSTHQAQVASAAVQTEMKLMLDALNAPLPAG
jgi:hypothetical protein